ncbi:MAG: 1-deoxy-D-xylulose-5-phosphate reductoisomerase [Kiloniellales bacterium]|nr:1-deoxy-D-xylulose-5-phosphate reductoisomerase [Kiloniellales bacterium]
MATAITRAKTRPEVAPRRVTILGSTGSVGCSTIDLLRRAPAAYDVEALTAHRNVEQLVAQAWELRPRLAVIADPKHYPALKQGLEGSGVAAAAGLEALVEAAQRPVDWVMAAIVGAAGLAPTLSAVRSGCVVALANKETLVCAGSLMIAEVISHGATLLPVDSEHNAIFQVLDQERPEGVEHLILTASGGPFRTYSREEMAEVTPEQAVAHPNWDMGAKISVDSATMMNKGLEIIEASHLFAMTEDRIEVLVHPQSVVHSAVAYIDGSVLAQMGSPDMRTPIAHTLAWPARIPAPVERLDLAAIGQLTFDKPDPERFPALRLARESLRDRPSTPIVLNAANEVAVDSFLADRLGFLQIAEVVERTMNKLPGRNPSSLDEVIDIDSQARRTVNEVIKALG